jgi:hypothetical protein
MLSYVHTYVHTLQSLPDLPFPYPYSHSSAAAVPPTNIETTNQHRQHRQHQHQQQHQRQHSSEKPPDLPSLARLRPRQLSIRRQSQRHPSCNHLTSQSSPHHLATCNLHLGNDRVPLRPAATWGFTPPRCPQDGAGTADMTARLHSLLHLPGDAERGTVVELPPLAHDSLFRNTEMVFRDGH